MHRLHLFGMAKSSTDLKGAKGPKLEGDFLRLFLAVTRCKERGDKAIGYLAVPTREGERRILTWVKKYNASGAVIPVLCDLSDVERVRLADEKARTARGMLPGANAALARADFGGPLLEEKLRAFIHGLHPGLREGKAPITFAEWDFYGMIAGAP